MDKEFYVFIDGEQSGPHSFSTLFSYFKTKVIGGETLLWAEGYADWLSLDNSPDLPTLQQMMDEELLSNQPPPPPPPPPRQVSIKRNSVKLNSSRASVRINNETAQRTASQRFLRAPVYERKNGVWVEDDSEVWVLSKILGQDNTVMTIQNLTTQVIKSIDVGFQDILLFNEIVVSDMTSLQYLHEPGILFNLVERSRLLFPYTYMSLVLIAMNPLQQLPTPEVSEFVDKPFDTEKPHPYAISEVCFQEMSLANGRNQSIVISGESGSGKTETAKLILNYLVHRNGHTTTLDCASGSGSGTVYTDNTIDTKLLESSLILESFGNCKTLHNNNSSRFGKLLKVFYESKQSQDRQMLVGTTQGYVIAGASIETYLLEKSRVIEQFTNEQNYHIFYMLLSAVHFARQSPSPSSSSPTGTGAGHDSSDLSSLLKDVHLQVDEPGASGAVDVASHYRIANPCSTHTNAAESSKLLSDYRDKFAIITSSLFKIGYTHSSISSIWSILASILEIGNIAFHEVMAANSSSSTQDSRAGNSSVVTEILNQDLCQFICTSIGVNYNAFVGIMTKRQIHTRGEKFDISLTLTDSNYMRDSICKTIYEKVFNNIVQVINMNLETSEEKSHDQKSKTARQRISDKESEKFIAILDIFGFENFAVNNFEQLLINYANEHLQSVFNRQIFTNELNLYSNEGIDCGSISLDNCPDNKDCVALIGDLSSKASIFSILNTVSKQIKPNDEKFIHELHKTITSHSYFPSPHLKDKQHVFIVKHYAGVVRYFAKPPEKNNKVGDSTWLAKNNDFCPEELLDVLASSCIPYLRDIIGNKNETVASKAVSTISITFSKSINSLCTSLDSTSCKFIRCIKPNSQMKVNVYNKSYIVNQIRSLGLLQACNVMAVGMPYRISFNDLKSILGSIIQDVKKLFHKASNTAAITLDGDIDGIDEQMLMTCILYALNIPPHVFQIGKTKIFFKAGQFEVLKSLISQSSNNIESKSDEILVRLQNVITSRKRIENDLISIRDKTELVNTSIEERKKDMKTLQTKLITRNNDNKLMLLYNELSGCIVELECNAQEVSKKYSTLLSKYGDHWIHLSFLAQHGDLKANYDSSFQTVKSNMSLLQSLETIALVDIHARKTSLQEYMQRSDSELSSVDDTILEKWDELNALHNMYTLIKKDFATVVQLSNQCKVDEADIMVSSATGQIEYILRQLETIKAFTTSTIDGENISERSTGQKYETYINAGNDLLNTVKVQMDVVVSRCEVDYDEVLKTLASVEKSCIVLKVEESKMKKDLEAKEIVRKQEEALEASRKEREMKENAIRKIEEEKVAREKQAAERTVNTDAKEDESEVEEVKMKQVVANRRGSVKVNNLASLLAEAKIEDAVLDDENILRAEPPATIPFESVEYLLPVGWEEYLDEASGCYYYCNMITQQSQWDRPYEPAASGGDMVPVEEKRNEKEVETAETKDVAQVTVASSSVISLADVEANANAMSTSLRPSKGTKPKTVHNEVVIKYSNDKRNIKYGRVTVSQLHEVGVMIKKGFLMKQSTGMFNRWKKKYFVLDGNVMECYEKMEHYNYGSKGGKQLKLTYHTITSYTTKDLCFTVRGNPGNSAVDGENDCWMLIAENANEMNEWIMYINAHVHALHVKRRLEQNNEIDHLVTSSDIASESMCFYQAIDHEPASSDKALIGIRSLPFVNGPRTGEGIVPGEYIEVEKTIDSDHVRFLQMSDSRGYIFERHPKLDLDLFSIVASSQYTYQVKEKYFKVDRNIKQGVPIFYSPGKISSKTGHYLTPSEDITVIATWKLDTDKETYLKLSDGRGWVCQQDDRLCDVVLPITSNPLSMR